jgi:hypothetical protein
VRETVAARQPERTAARKVAHWQHTLAANRVWGCSAASTGRARAAYGYAAGRQASGARRGQRGQKLHRPRWVVLGWQHGRLRRIVAGWWCQAVSTDARLVPAPLWTLRTDGTLELNGYPFALCQGCEREITDPGHNWRQWRERNP